MDTRAPSIRLASLNPGSLGTGSLGTGSLGIVSLGMGPALALLVALLLLPACGGGSRASQGPPSQPGAFVASTESLADGDLWQLNRAITILTNRELDFGSVHTESVSIEPLQGGPSVSGTYGPGLDPVTGVSDPTSVRFQPACPLLDGGPSGFAQGVEYVLTVRGADTSSFPMRSTAGEELETTFEITFSTPVGDDPAVLFYDAVPGPPRVSFRGQSGVPLDDPDTTRIEHGGFLPVSVLLRRSPSGQVEVDPDFSSLLPFGLPLNHYIVPENRIAIVLEFDQPILLSSGNLARIGIDFFDFFDGTWRPIPSRAEPVASCGRRGSAVRLKLIGSLPPTRPLRLRLDQGFADLVGQSLPAATYEELPLQGASDANLVGSRVDAIYENFFLSGDEPGSMEDTVSVLDAPRGFWGSGLIAGVETPSGVSVVRSKWYPIGRAGHDGVGTPQTPTFYFTGTDAAGVVRAEGGTVVLDPPSLGPLAPVAISSSGLTLSFGDLLEPTALYAAQPSLLTGDRMRIRPDPEPGTEFSTRILGAIAGETSVDVGVGSGCYLPGLFGDCVPWDLTALFPNLASTRVEVVSRSFEVYTWVTRDLHSLDHRVTITFDAARAGADGTADASTAFSLGGGWTPEVSDLSGQPWDFLRFEVRFELDVSGDGYDPLERSPLLNFIKVPVDFRR